MFSTRTRRVVHRLSRAFGVALIGGGIGAATAQNVTLADRPLFSTTGVPGNLMLALSVEWPTANTPAYLSTAAYAATSTYLGYFDPKKCYQYNNATNPAQSYFSPASSGSATCASRWLSA